MNSPSTNDVLNRLAILHNRSLAAYLKYACPWMGRGGAKAAAMLAQIGADQQEIVGRVGELILDSDGEVAHGQFPLAFASLHYLSWDFLLPKLIEHQRRDIASMEECASQLGSAPEARAAADAALTAAKRHLNALLELQQDLAQPN